jgi:hypothetical protein
VISEVSDGGTPVRRTNVKPDSLLGTSKNLVPAAFMRKKHSGHRLLLFAHTLLLLRSDTSIPYPLFGAPRLDE